MEFYGGSVVGETRSSEKNEQLAGSNVLKLYGVRNSNILKPRHGHQRLESEFRTEISQLVGLHRTCCGDNGAQQLRALAAITLLGAIFRPTTCYIRLQSFTVVQCSGQQLNASRNVWLDYLSIGVISLVVEGSNLHCLVTCWSAPRLTSP